MKSARKPSLRHGRCWIALCVAAAALLAGLTSAPGAQALEVRATKYETVEFSGDSCAAVSRTVAVPRRARNVRLLNVRTGEQIPNFDGDGAVRIVRVVRARRAFRVVAQPDDALCDPDRDPGTADAWQTYDVEAAVRYRRFVGVYVRGTGRGGRTSYRPRVLPFGTRSSVVGLRWRRWNRSTTFGRGQVEYNPCVPNCAESRPAYYRVRVSLSRPRNCAGRYKYTLFRFRYSSRRRPAGVGRSYRERFGC